MKKILSLVLIFMLIISAVPFGVIAAQTSNIIGDVNGDGKVNNKDLGVLMQYVNDWSIEINKDFSDVNGDGKINNKDLGLLMQYVNNWDVTLTPPTQDDNNDDDGGIELPIDKW